jgi:hypothetical protein
MAPQHRRLTPVAVLQFSFVAQYSAVMPLIPAVALVLNAIRCGRPCGGRGSMGLTALVQAFV